MKVFKYSLLYFCAIFFISCSKTQIQRSDNYKEILENLIFKYTDLDQLSSYTGVEKKIIVGMAYGKYAINEDLSSALDKLLDEFVEDEVDGLEELNNNNSILGKSLIQPISNKNLSRHEIRTLEVNKHSQFQDTLNTSIVKIILRRKQDFLESKFSVWKIIPLIVERVKYNKEDIIKKWNIDLNSKLNFPGINERIQKQVDSYTDYINMIHHINNIENEFKSPVLKLDNSIKFTNKSYEDDIISRLNNEIYSSVYSTLIELVIGLMITLIINKMINKRIKRNIDSFAEFGKSIWKNKENGLWKKIAFSGIGLLNFTVNNNEIRKKYERRKKYLNVSTTIVFIVAPFILFDYQSTKLEDKIDTFLSQAIVEYFQNQNIEILSDLLHQTNAL